MRTGAIFARGSCRALKWVALMGMVFAMGAGHAFAQITANPPDTVLEGTRFEVPFSAVIEIDDDNFPEEGGEITVEVTLARPAAVPPSMSSMEALTPGEVTDLGGATATVTIELPAGQKSGTVSGSVWFDTETDEDAEDEYFTVTYGVPTATGGVTEPRGIELKAPAADSVVIDDAETQRFVWQDKDGGDINRADLEEDSSVTVKLMASPALEEAMYETHFLLSDDRYMINVPDHEFAKADERNSVDITITAPKSDGNRIEDTVTLTAYKAGTRMSRASLPITVADSDPLEVLRPKPQPQIDAAVMSARTKAEGSDGRWVRGDTTVNLPLAELFHLPDAGYRVTAGVEADNTDTIIALGIQDSPQGDFVYLRPGDAGTATVTVIASAEKISSSATMQLTDTSAQVEFALKVDAPAPREPRVESTDAVITALDLEGSEQRTIGGVKRLHIDEGTRTEVSATVEWSVGQLREIYDLDSTPDPVVVRFGLRLGGASLPDWLSAADPNGDPSEDFGDDYWSISIKIPKLPAATKKDWERVEGEGSTPFNIHEDTDAEDEAFEIIVGSGSSGVSLDTSDSKTSTGQVVIDDDETQTIEIKRITKGDIYEGGGDQEFEVSADPALNDLGLEVDFDLTNSDGSNVRAYGVSPSSDVIYAGGKAAITIDIDNSDGNRKDDELVLHADIDSRNRSDVGADTFKFMVIDVHKLPHLTVDPASDTVAEGGEIELTLTLDRNPSNTRAVDPEMREYTSEAIDVMVDMLPEGIEITPRPVKFPKHNGKAPWTQEMKVEVTAKPNDDLDGERMVALTFEAAGTMAENGMGSGDGDEHMAVATLTIEDGTDTLVWARSPEDVEAAVMAAKKAGMGDDMMLTAGEMIELKGIDLFGSAQGVDVGYTAMVEGDAVSESVSGGVVTITADSMGMAKVTITARASRPSGAVTINDQTDPREASITIALEVGLVALSIELSGPEEMNIVEGMDHANGTKASAMVTATANRKVTEDVTVTLMRDRAMSSADDMDFTAEPITIMAGQTTGSTRVMAVADDMMENEGNMAEELVLYGMAADNAGEVTGHVKLYLWDAAVPALPVIAQLLLAAFLALGGYRRYLRR